MDRLRWQRGPLYRSPAPSHHHLLRPQFCVGLTHFSLSSLSHTRTDEILFPSVLDSIFALHAILITYCFCLLALGLLVSFCEDWVKFFQLVRFILVVLANFHFLYYQGPLGLRRGRSLWFSCRIFIIPAVISSNQIPIELFVTVLFIFGFLWFWLSKARNPIFFWCSSLLGFMLVVTCSNFIEKEWLL